MKTPNSESELRELFARVCDQTAAQEELEWLDDALRKHARIRWSYLEFTSAESAIPLLVKRATQKSDATEESSPSMVELVLVNESSTESKSRQKPVAFPTFSKLAKTIDWRNHPGRFLAVVAMLTVSAWCVPLAMVHVAERLNDLAQHSPLPVESPAKDSILQDSSSLEFAAKLIKTQDALWDNESQALLNSNGKATGEIATGQQMKLEQGLALFEFSSGAKVAIEGPSSFTFTGRNSGKLDVGELTALVNEASQGFTVNTPNAVVRDLGTEFGLRVDDDGLGSVSVFQGVVELENDSNLAGRPVRLAAGKAAGLDGAIQNSLAVNDSFAGKREFLVSDRQERLPIAKDETIRLTADMAKISGDALRYDAHNKSLGRWVNTQAYPSWEFDVETSGLYDVVLSFGCTAEEAGGKYSIEIDGIALGKRKKTVNTGDWTKFVKTQIGQVDLSQGSHTLAIRNHKERNIGKGLMDVRSVALKRLAEPSEK